MDYLNHPKSVKALCIIIHGMGEHAKRYQSFLQALEKASIQGVAIDLPYHGEIEDVGIFQKITPDEYLESIHQMILPYTKKFNNVPKVMLGHSMGSLIARRYAEIYPDMFDSMIWMGTMPMYSNSFSYLMRSVSFILRIFIPFKKRHHLLAGLMNQSLNKKMAKKESSFAWLSYNQANVKAYEEDPYSGYAYNGYFYSFFFKLIQLTNQPKEIQKTTLQKVFLISGEDDPVTGTKDTFKRIINIYQKMNPFIAFDTLLQPNMRHEILHEKDAKIIYAILAERIVS